MVSKKGPPVPDALAARIRKILQGAADASAAQPSTDATRRAARSPAFKPATLTFISGQRMDVVVKNFSDTGARVDFVQDIELPERVLLTEPMFRLKRWACVAWQTRGSAGLEFVDTDPEKPAGV